MGFDDLLEFDEEKYSQSLHSKYPTIAELKANEKKKSAQIASASGSGLVGTGIALFWPPALLGVGLSGRKLSIARQKRNLIREELKRRYDVEKTSMSEKTFFKNAGRAGALKALTFGAIDGLDDLCTAAIPPDFDAASHGFDATAGPAGDNTYDVGADIGDHVAREAKRGAVKLAINGGSNLVSSQLNNPTTSRSRPITSKSTSEPTTAPTAAKAQEKYRGRKKVGLANTTQTRGNTQKAVTAAVTPAQPTSKCYTSTTKQLKGRPQLRWDEKPSNNTANWIIAACIFIPVVVIFFYSPSFFRIWLNVLSSLLVDLLVIISYALVETTRSVMVILRFMGYALVKITNLVMVVLSFVGYLLGSIAELILTVVPNVISFVGFGLFKFVKAVLEIFDFV